MVRQEKGQRKSSLSFTSSSSSTFLPPVELVSVDTSTIKSSHLSGLNMSFGVANREGFGGSTTTAISSLLSPGSNVNVAAQPTPTFLCHKCRRGLFVEKNIMNESEAILKILRSIDRESKLKKDDNLFEELLLEANRFLEIDLPLCEDCIDYAIKDIKKEQEEVVLAKDLTASSLDDLSSGDSSISEVQEEIEYLERKIKIELEEEGDLRSDLIQLENENKDLRKEIKQLELSLQTLETSFSQISEVIVDVDIKSHDLGETIASVEAKKNSVITHLSRLTQTDMLSQAFHIWSDGHFGTINGLKLGSLPVEPVEWQEINAALGYVALLIETIRKRARISNRGFSIIPNGSFSKITRNSEKKEFDLFGVPQTLTNVLMRPKAKFDNAITCLMDCLKHIIQESRCCERPEFRLNNINMVDQTIDGISWLRNDDKVWTTAMRHLLNNLKLLQLWCIQNDSIKKKKALGLTTTT